MVVRGSTLGVTKEQGAVPQALAARYGLTAGPERPGSRGLWTKLSLDITKNGQEPRLFKNEPTLGSCALLVIRVNRSEIATREARVAH